MKIAYLDCFAGLSGDMFLGALIGAGVERAVLDEAVESLGLQSSITLRTVDRSGISSLKVDVLEGESLAEDTNATFDGFQDQARREPVYSHQPETQHQHGSGTPDTHTPSAAGRGREHGRSLTAIRGLIQAASLPPAVVHTAVRAFELLGDSEARIHNVAVDEIHFHEVGAVDAIVDIVAASAAIHALAADRWVASPVNVGAGMVECAHGRFPIPAPATADLLRGMPTYSAHVRMELVTPTGAALLRVLVEDMGLTFGPQPAMTVQTIGYGAGSRDPAGFPNVLRLSVGEASGSREEEQRPGAGPETVTVLETALDDLSPQLLAHVAEAALKQGALDVMLTPVIMKKGRPGTLLTVLCDAGSRASLEHLLLTETTTLGIRVREDRRSCLDRTFTPVQTEYGEIKIKVGKRNGEAWNANPEFEDCRAAAAMHNVPVKVVHQAAVAAYASSLSLSEQPRSVRNPIDG